MARAVLYPPSRTKEIVMSKTRDPKLQTIDADTLDDVTGGGAGKGASGGSATEKRLDGLISELNSITTAAKNIDNKTKGFDDKQMMLLVLLAMDRRRGRRW